MIEPIAIFAIIVVVGIFYVIPILTIYSIFKWAKKKFKIKVAYSILAFLSIILLFKVYTDFYPLEYSYKRNFENNSELNFPKSAKFLDKLSQASIFDFGGIMYCSKIEINNDDYNKLKKEIEKSKFIKVDNYTLDFDTDPIFSKIEDNDIDEIFRVRKSKDEYFVIFLSDKKTIILFYNSW